MQVDLCQIFHWINWCHALFRQSRTFLWTAHRKLSYIWYIIVMLYSCQSGFLPECVFSYFSDRLFPSKTQESILTSSFSELCRVPWYRDSTWRSHRGEIFGIRRWSKMSQDNSVRCKTHSRWFDNRVRLPFGPTLTKMTCGIPNVGMQTCQCLHTCLRIFVIVTSSGACMSVVVCVCVGGSSQKMSNKYHWSRLQTAGGECKVWQSSTNEDSVDPSVLWWKAVVSQLNHEYIHAL